MKSILVLAAAAALVAGAASAEGQFGQHFLEIWDHDSNGEVTLAEATEQRENLFASFDANDDGVLSAAEYEDFDAAREADVKDHGGGNSGQGKGGAGRAMQSMTVEFNDVDGDGEVTAQEFSSRSSGLLEMMDRNGDGVLSVEDFGPRSG